MNRGKPWVGGLVALCLAAVLYLLVTAPADADLVSVVHTTLEDFNAGTLYHTGLARFDDGEVQLLVVGLAGSWITDTNTTGLPPLFRHTAVHHDGRIFVLGGVGGEASGSEPTRGVYSTTILADHDLADWQPANPLPASIYPDDGVALHASVVVGDWLYVIGGWNESLESALKAVTFAPIGPGGRLGTWQPTASLPMSLCQPQAVVVSDTIYVIGGWDNTSTHYDKVYFARPNLNTGEIAGWTPTADFVHVTYGHMAAASGGRIYVLGGFNPDLPPAYVSPYTRYTDLDPDTGHVISWTKATNMPNNYYAAAALSFAGQLYMTGGAKNSMYDVSSDVGSTLIADDGSIGAWYDTDVIDPARFFHAAVHSDDGWLYIINGSDGSGPIDPSSINRGATAGAGENYAPDGTFTSQIVDMGQARRLVELNWNTTITDTSMMAITMYFRTKKSTVAPWSGWYGPYPSSSTPGTVTTTLSLLSPSKKARFFQYEAHLATDDQSMTPFLNKVEVIYNIPVPKFEIGKDSMPPPGSMVGLSDTIYYTLTYINDIWSITATQAYIEDAPPQYTSYRPGSIWGGVDRDDSNPALLHWDLGEVLPGDTGTVGYAVIVSPTLGQEVILRNTATFFPLPFGNKTSNPVTHTVGVPPLELEVSKEAVPPPGAIVLPGSFITYTISYSNAGEVWAHQVVLTDTYDLNRSYDILSTDPPPVLQQGQDRDIWQPGLLGPGQGGQIAVAVQLTDTLPNHWPVSNRATLDSLYSPLLISDVVTHMVFFSGVDLVDLRVGGIRWQPVPPGPKTPVVFSAAITNTGTLDADTYFYAELYIRPDPPNRPLAPWDHDQGYCLDDCASTRENYVAYVGTLPKGESTKVVFSGSDVEFDRAGWWDVCVQVDVSFDHEHYNLYWGVYPEDYESNNIACVAVEILPEWKIYLPRVVRRWR